MFNNKKRKSIQVIELNDNSLFVRARSDQHSIEDLMQRAEGRSVSNSYFREVWKAIRDIGVKEIHYPEGLQDLNDKDAYIAKKAVIESAKVLGKRTVRNYPKTGIVNNQPDLSVA
jgi:hypothetical protein